MLDTICNSPYDWCPIPGSLLYIRQYVRLFVALLGHGHGGYSTNFTYCMHKYYYYYRQSMIAIGCQRFWFRKSIQPKRL